MTKMNIAPEDRTKVQSEIFRIMRTLKLDPARSRLIGVFMETYLKLTAAQKQELLRELDKLPPKEREETMELMTYWEKQGLKMGRAEGRVEGKVEGREEGQVEGKAEGRVEGKETLVARQIGKRFGFAPPQILERLDHLSAEQLDEFGEALFDFNELTDLGDWLKQRFEQ